MHYVGGADGRYTLVGYYNYTDVPHREANYVMQGIHTTKVNHYNDTVNYAIYPTANGNSSRVKVRMLKDAPPHTSSCMV